MIDIRGEGKVKVQSWWILPAEGESEERRKEPEGKGDTGIGAQNLQ